MSAPSGSLTPLPDVKRRAYDLLFRELGYVDAVRFIHLIGAGRGNYTEERRDWIDRVTMDELIAEIEEIQGGPLAEQEP